MNLKNNIKQILLCLFIMIIPFPLHITGLMPLIMNDSGANYLPLSTIALLTSFITISYLIYFFICYIIIKAILGKIAKNFVLNKKIFCITAFIMPFIFCSLYIITYRPDNLLSVTVQYISENVQKNIHQNDIQSMETSILNYEHICEFTFLEDDTNAQINFYIQPNADEIISKLSCGSDYEYKVYNKFSHDDFWYLLNSANVTFKDNSDRNLSHLQHENLESKTYFKYNDIQFVAVSYPQKSFAVLIEFIQIGESYYISDYHGYNQSDNEKKYQDLIKQLWSNRAIFSTNFFNAFGYDDDYFDRLQNENILLIDGDYFKINDTPLVYVYR